MVVSSWLGIGFMDCLVSDVIGYMDSYLSSCVELLSVSDLVIVYRDLDCRHRYD